MSAGTKTRRRHLAGRLALIGVLAACSPTTPTASPDAPVPSQASTAPASMDPSAAPSNPQLAFTTCPDDVTVVMVVVPTCGFLTVPEDRDESGGRSIRILVVRIEPPGGVEAPDPMAVVGETLGAHAEYGGLAAHAQRTGRIVYVIDRRGTGLSEPALDCPEVAAASRGSLSLPSRDARATSLLIDALAACRDRLIAADVDLSAYGLRESARDVEAVRVALGHRSWNVIAFGSASRLAIEVARVAPEGVRTVVMDSPVLPQGPDPMFAAGATKSVIARVEAACIAAPACGERHPDVARALAQAVDRLDAEPITISVPGLGDGGPTDVPVDGVRFARGVRGVLAWQGGAVIDDLLDSIDAARAGRLTVNDPVLQLLTRDDPLCLGYVPDCTRVVTGSLLATACGDVLPVVDREAALALGAGVPGMAGLFEASPFFAACDTWAVSPDPETGEPIRTTIPILAMVGAFDPFTGPAPDLAGAAGLEGAVVLEVPNHSYNVFGYNECPRQVRREWLDDPDHVPDTGCFADLGIVDFAR